MTHQNSPLKRLENESQQAFDAFIIYAEMGYSNRSIDKAYLKATNQEETSKKSNHHWFKWSKEFNWQNRVRDYDDWVFDERIREKVRLRKFIIEDLGDRLKADLEKDLEITEELANHLKRFLEKGDLTTLAFKSFCMAHKDIVTTRKEIYQTYLGLTGINFLSEQIAEQEKKNYN